MGRWAGRWADRWVGRRMGGRWVGQGMCMWVMEGGSAAMACALYYQLLQAVQSAGCWRGQPSTERRVGGCLALGADLGRQGRVGSGASGSLCSGWWQAAKQQRIGWQWPSKPWAKGKETETAGPMLTGCCALLVTYTAGWPPGWLVARLQVWPKPSSFGCWWGSVAMAPSAPGSPSSRSTSGECMRASGWGGPWVCGYVFMCVRGVHPVG